MRVAYADPPYPEQAGPRYGEAEVDHAELLKHLDSGYDGWLLHTSSTGLRAVLRAADQAEVDGFRIMAWLKSFAAFKKNVSVAYAWEPVLVKAARKPTVSKRTLVRGSELTYEEPGQPIVFRDVCAESITLRKGTIGAKPEMMCRWAFEMLGLEPEDHLVDLYPGSGAVLAAWDAWRREIRDSDLYVPSLSKARRMSARQRVEPETAECNRTRGGTYTFNLFPPEDWDGYIFTVAVLRLGDHAHLDVRTGHSTIRGEGTSGGEAGHLVMAWAHWLHLRGMLEHHAGVRIAEVECPTHAQLKRHGVVPA